jgi:rod shape-determining protein MreC
MFRAPTALQDRQTRRRATTYGGLLALCLLLVVISDTAPLREFQKGIGFAFAPVQSVLSSTTRGAVGIFTTIAEIDQLRQRNAELSTENEQLKAQVQGALESQRELRILSDILGVKTAVSYTTVAAQVIAREASPFQRVISIDVGSDKGVTTSDVVLGGGAALVGRVVEVGRDYARILLISDSASTVIGLDTTTGATGEVIGRLGGTLAMQNIAITEEVSTGDEVVTAGIDLGNGIRSAFPKGLVIGRIVDVRKEPNAVVQSAFLEPASDLDRLEYVLVVVGFQVPELPAPGSSPNPSPASPEASPATSPAASPSASPSS